MREKGVAANAKRSRAADDRDQVIAGATAFEYGTTCDLCGRASLNTANKDELAKVLGQNTYEFIIAERAIRACRPHRACRACYAEFAVLAVRAMPCSLCHRSTVVNRY